jgi:hypothetical protein
LRLFFGSFVGGSLTRPHPLAYVVQGVYPSYFTYRQEPSSTAWKEEEKIRNIEPALASQLELNRLSNFNVTPIFVENRQIRSSPPSPFLLLA